MARTRTRTFRVVPEDTRRWDLFLKDFLAGLEGVEATDLADLAGLSVMGRATNTAGAPSAITAGSDGDILRRLGTNIGFGSILSTSISDFDERAQDAVGTIFGASATISFTYTDATPSITAAIVADSVSDSLLRNSAALSVIGRSANSVGDPGDIVAANDGEAFRRSGATLGFGTIATAGIGDDQVTNAKAANMAEATIKGRASGAGTGDPTDLTAAQVATIVSSAVASALNITTGTYTPTFTNTANIDASGPLQAQYVRISDIVIVSGRLTVDATAAGGAELGISLPIASNFGAIQDCGGVAFANAVAGQGGAILGDVANDRANLVWVAVDTANRAMSYIFMYRVI